MKVLFWDHTFLSSLVVVVRLLPESCTSFRTADSWRGSLKQITENNNNNETILTEDYCEGSFKKNYQKKNKVNNGKHLDITETAIF